MLSTCFTLLLFLCNAGFFEKASWEHDPYRIWLHKVITVLFSWELAAAWKKVVKLSDGIKFEVVMRKSRSTNDMRCIIIAPKERTDNKTNCMRQWKELFCVQPLNENLISEIKNAEFMMANIWILLVLPHKNDSIIHRMSLSFRSRLPEPFRRKKAGKKWKKFHLRR